MFNTRRSQYDHFLEMQRFCAIWEFDFSQQGHQQNKVAVLSEKKAEFYDTFFGKNVHWVEKVRNAQKKIFK